MGTVIADFEQAEHHAISATYPSTRIQGCLFHFKQCLVRRFQRIPEYTTKPLVKERLHYLFGLAFIPEDDVISAWAVLKPLLLRDPILLPIMDSVRPIFDYMDTTWMDGLYKVEMWNVYDAVLSDSPRTNNYSEGNNSALNAEAGCSHPGVPRLLEILKRFNEDADAAIMFAITGAETELVRKRDARCVQLNERIKRAVSFYGKLSVLMYCKSLGSLNYV